MAKDNDGSTYSVGYKKPPRHTQFKPGRSGNPHGRPKKTDTVAEVLARELNKIAPLPLKDGRKLRLPMRDFIIRRLLLEAAKGNVKAAALALPELKSPQPEGGNNLPMLVHEFRTRYARLAADTDQPHHQNRVLTAPGHARPGGEDDIEQ